MSRQAETHRDPPSPSAIRSGREALSVELCLDLHRIMVRARAMEELMIKMSKSGLGYFWIGGPGEEAFNACLGLLARKGCGPEYDYLHLHYRNSATMVAMGMPLVEGIRQMAMTATDTHSLGRNFTCHFSKREWNVVPISSVIEVQYVMAPGTALVQKRVGGRGISIVCGGDAGTAEGDFASCLVWSSRPGNELPVLMVVTNNAYGISTPACSQHGEKQVIDRGRAFGIPGEVVDGNDPVASWHAISRAREYCESKRRPFMLEARVSRLYGHSSSSGALRVPGEPDCIELFEEKLLAAGAIDQHGINEIHLAAQAEAEAALEQALAEPQPGAEHIPLHTYAPSQVDAFYPRDFDQLPTTEYATDAPPMGAASVGDRSDGAPTPQGIQATLVQGVRLALHYAEEHLGLTDVFGEDVGPPLGGVFTATQGLKTAWNSPLDERGIVGMAMGIAYAGGRPVAEIQFCDYGFNTIDLLKVAGNQRWAGAGQFDLPMVLMMPSGSGIRGSLYHSHSFESWASRLAGWKIAMPSNARDAYGLMLTAIADPNPVMLLLPKALLRVKSDERVPGEELTFDELKARIDAPVGDRSSWKPRWPRTDELYIPFGVGRRLRQGSDATVVSYGRTLPLCVQAADQLAAEGIHYDVIDLRTIFPYDWPLVSESISRTGRVLLVNEDTEVTNFGEHLLRRAIDEQFYELLARPRLLAGRHVPGIGLNQAYEQHTVPQLPNIVSAMRELAREEA